MAVINKLMRLQTLNSNKLILKKITLQVHKQHRLLRLKRRAQQLKTLQDKAQQSSGFDSEKVAELKKAITEGKYQIDAEKLTKNLADFEFNVYG